MAIAYGSRVPGTVIDNRPVALWLFAVSVLLLAMVVLGGVTRLTNSGLSITEWKPVTGVLPPLSEAAWAAEFESYRGIPEYQLINKGMGLEGFKRIYWYEWSHRLLGRAIGLAFALPFLWFLLRGRLERPMAWRLAAILALGGSQGALGWFMVMSGLSDRVDVSQYRLAAHLGLAFVIQAATFWTALDLWRPAARSARPGRIAGPAVAAVALVFVQVILGAFVAGTDAGFAYNTWPLMDGDWIPAGLLTYQPAWLDLFENTITIQFVHRHFALVVGLAVAVLWLAARRRAPASAGAADLLMGAMAGQILLGIATLVLVVPVWLGALHQAGAFILFTASLNLAHRLRRS